MVPGLPCGIARWLLVLGCLAGCDQDRASAPAAPAAADVGVAYPRDPQVLVLWLEEIPGYVSAATAARYHAHPHRFALWGDGRAVFRNDAFEHTEVRLTDAEVQSLFRALRATGLEDVENARLPNQPGRVLLDAGAERIGVNSNAGRRVWEVMAPGYHLKQEPGDPAVAAFAKARALLRAYGDPKIGQ